MDHQRMHGFASPPSRMVDAGRRGRECCVWWDWPALDDDDDDGVDLQRSVGIKLVRNKIRCAEGCVCMCEHAHARGTLIQLRRKKEIYRKSSGGEGGEATDVVFALF
jgi:hypothetical protein